MPRPIQKWPHYALWALENADDCLSDIERRSREAQELLRAGHVLEAVILLGDVRARAVEARSSLAKGRNGER